MLELLVTISYFLPASEETLDIANLVPCSLGEFSPKYVKRKAAGIQSRLVQLVLANGDYCRVLPTACIVWGSLRFIHPSSALTFKEMS